MRIDKLIQNRSQGVLTKNSYERLKCMLIFPKVTYEDGEGWDTEQLDNISRKEAEKKINTYRRMVEYERNNSLTPSLKAIEIHLVNPSEKEDIGSPEWPEELQPFYTECFAEAYLRNKFELDVSS